MPTVAIVLPRRAGPAQAETLAMVRAVHALPGAFAPVLVGPDGVMPPSGMAYHVALHGWWQISLRRRYAGAVVDTLRRLRPDVVEVHDTLTVAALVSERMRPVPVVAVLHSDPQAQRRWRDPASRTYLLAQVTRAATATPDWRRRLLEGVHHAMHHCDLLPDWSTALGARRAADALDTLRHDALQAWSRRLDVTI